MLVAVAGVHPSDVWPDPVGRRRATCHTVDADGDLCRVGGVGIDRPPRHHDGPRTVLASHLDVAEWLVGDPMGAARHDDGLAPVADGGETDLERSVGGRRRDGHGVPVVRSGVGEHACDIGSVAVGDAGHRRTADDGHLDVKWVGGAVGVEDPAGNINGIWCGPGDIDRAPDVLVGKRGAESGETVAVAGAVGGHVGRHAVPHDLHGAAVGGVVVAEAHGVPHLMEQHRRLVPAADEVALHFHHGVRHHPEATGGGDGVAGTARCERTAHGHVGDSDHDLIGGRRRGGVRSDDHARTGRVVDLLHDSAHERANDARCVGSHADDPADAGGGHSRHEPVAVTLCCCGGCNPRRRGRPARGGRCGEYQHQERTHHSNDAPTPPVGGEIRS